LILTTCLFANKLLDDPRPNPAPSIIHPIAGTIGSLLEKRYVPVVLSESQRDLDWALCSLDRARAHLTNNISLPNGTTLYPTQAALQNPSHADVWIHTGTTGLMKGFLTGDYSLVALPGSRTFQRMWIVVLDRLVRKCFSFYAELCINLSEKCSSLVGPGDCGSWVIDSTSGIWYGQIVAAKPETAVAYIVLARDILRDIQDQFGGRHVRMPIESDFVNEAVTVVKRDLSRSSSTAQGSPQRGSTWSNISCQSKGRTAFHGRKVTFRSIKLMRRFTGQSPVLGQENHTGSIEMQRKTSFPEIQSIKLLT
jgi:hypothetical protein